jgi:hypothetical protein
MVLLRATRRVLRSIVGPALGVPLATLAAAAALSACAKSSDAGGTYTGPVGMVPMAQPDAEAAIPVGIPPVGSAATTPTAPSATAAIPGTPVASGTTPVPPKHALPGLVRLPVPGTAPQPDLQPVFPGTRPMPQPQPVQPGFAPSTAVAAAPASRPTRAARRSTDADDRPRYAAFSAPRALG